jgi:hypothetical protein
MALTATVILLLSAAENRFSSLSAAMPSLSALVLLSCGGDGNLPFMLHIPLPWTALSDGKVRDLGLSIPHKYIASDGIRQRQNCSRESKEKKGNRATIYVLQTRTLIRGGQRCAFITDSDHT